jgi:hypothetical protein
MRNSHFRPGDKTWGRCCATHFSWPDAAVDFFGRDFTSISDAGKKPALNFTQAAKGAARLEVGI